MAKTKGMFVRSRACMNADHAREKLRRRGYKSMTLSQFYRYLGSNPNVVDGKTIFVLGTVNNYADGRTCVPAFYGKDDKQWVSEYPSSDPGHHTLSMSVYTKNVYYAVYPLEKSR